MPSPKVYMLNPNPSVTIFGDKVFKEIIKIKWGRTYLPKPK